MEGCESCVASRCNSVHWVFKGMFGHLHAQRSRQYIFLKSPARIRHVIRAGVSFSRDCLSCDLKWCFSTSSHVYVLRSWLTAANRCIVLQFRWDPPNLSRAWYVFGEVVPCCRIYLYLIVLNHDWLHFHKNVRRHARALWSVWSRTCWVNLELIVLISTPTAVNSSYLYSSWFNFECLRKNHYETRARIEHSWECGSNTSWVIEFFWQLRRRGTDGWGICWCPVR
jgi:hypothetical protein